LLSLVLHMVSHCRARIGRTDTPPSKDTKEAVLRALPYVIFISFCLTQSVCTGIFSAWDCVEFMHDSVTGETREFLREDLSIECYTDEHDQVKNVARFFVAVWPIGIPLLYLALLSQCRAALYQGRSTSFTRATSFLHKEYMPHYFWWELLFVVQRLMVTGFVMLFLRASKTVPRILVGIYFTVAYMGLLLICRPYRQRDLNFLAAVGAQFAIGCTMLNALCIRIFDEIKASSGKTAVQAEQDAKRIMGFDSPADIVGVTIAFAFLALSIVISRSAYDTTVEARAMAKAQVSSGITRWHRRLSSALGQPSTESSTKNGEPGTTTNDSAQPSESFKPIVV